jgi:UDPglucose 6-dehydrogenase
MKMKKICFLVLIIGILNLYSYASIDSIAVIGIGRLGLCLALCMEQTGYTVIGLDINQAYVESLNNKTFKSLEPGVNELLEKSVRLKATCSLDEALSAKIIYITVDTPTKEGENEYDHSKINAVLSEINKRKVQNKHIVVASTVFPGYIKKTAQQLIKDCVNTTLNYNPLFIAQGEIIKGLQNPDLVLIGEGSPEAGDVIESIQKRISYNTPAIRRMSIASAEITKLAINCYITTKIAYANMIGDIADNTAGADKDAILEAVGSDKRIGHACLKAGYGFGGPCFPRDNRALGAYATAVGTSTLLPRTIDTENALHAGRMADRLLAQNKGEYVFESVTYKDNCPVPIIEESQKLEVAKIIAEKGKRVIIKDRADVIAEVQKKFETLFEYQEVA